MEREKVEEEERGRRQKKGEREGEREHLILLHQRK